MSLVVTGAVNGVPTTAEVADVGMNEVTIPFFPTGTTASLNVDTDGSGIHTPNHRVAFIAGNTLARDHFPFPAGSYPSTNNYPILIPLVEAMLLVWRVRRWRVHGTLSNSRDVSLTTSFDWTATIGDDLGRDLGEQASDVTTESELVVRGNVFIDSSEVLNSPDGGVYEFAMFNTTAELAFTAFGFKPRLTFRVFAASAIDTVLDSRSTSVSGGGVATTVDAYINIAGIHRAFTMYVSPSETGTITGTLVIEPSEYWPYANIDGNAVYDTTTGAQLLDPLS